MTYEIHHGDCLEVLRGLPSDSIDAIVTDPPYGLTANKKGGTGVASVNLDSPYGRARIGTGNGAGGFMGLKWDSDVPPVDVWIECLRVLKPGGHLLAFAGTRTQHRMAVRIEDAGFEIRDMIAWVYGSGFPKSHNGPWGGTALKPALEPITVARKPLIGTVAANFAEHGAGGLNIDGCRVEAPDGVPLFSSRGESNGKTLGDGLNGSNRTGEIGAGRWPANLLHDGSEEVLAAFPMQTSGSRAAGVRKGVGYGSSAKGDGGPCIAGSSGSAARFFYCAKASKRDRDEGLEGFEKRASGMVSNTSGQHMTRRDEGYEVAPRANHHPTVKPTELMRYLCRLVTPPDGVVLDPFTGSGSTGKAAILEGFRFIGIEREAEYVEIARARVEAALIQEILK